MKNMEFSHDITVANFNISAKRANPTCGNSSFIIILYKGYCGSP
jgi:hypothetical protein